MDYESIKDIKIESLYGFFPKRVITSINEWEIIYLKEIFDIYDRGKISCLVKKKDVNNLMMGIKLLKCKYFNEDPEINMDNNDIEEICRLLGLSSRIRDGLMDYCKMNPDFIFFDFIKSNDALKILGSMDKVGKIYALEVYERAKIVVNYYKKLQDGRLKRERENISKEDKEILEGLYSELDRLKKDGGRIDTEIEFLLLEIDNKLHSINGGVKKWAKINN